MAQEEEFRQLQAEVEGIDSAHSLSYAGRSWPLRDGGDLVALLRYASLSLARQGTPRGSDAETEVNQRVLAATHRVLSECIADFAAFQEHAIASKITEEQVAELTNRVIEILTARPAHAAIRLLGWIVHNLGELDGKLLITTGAGAAGRSARQMCNIAFTMLVEQLEPERREEWIADLNAKEDPQQTALRLALEMIEKKKADGEAAPAAAPPPVHLLQPGPDDEFTVDLN